MVAPWVTLKAVGSGDTDAHVYWQWLNDHGGIHGRRVNFLTVDTTYTPQGSVQAAQQCNSSNPFLLSSLELDGGVAVRQWAEDNKMLFFPMQATRNGAFDFRYTFYDVPSYYVQGAVLGRYVGAKLRSKIGIVWRNSPAWREGRDGFAAEVTKKGSPVVADVSVSANQGDYTSAILAMENAHAETVLAIMNSIEFTQLVQQASAQGYHPRWVTTHPSHIETDTIASEIDGSKGPPAIAQYIFTEYHYGDRSSPWSVEAKLMEDAYAKYSSNKTPVDFDWLLWLVNKGLTTMLMNCGAGCNRNLLAGMMLAGYKQHAPPLCDIDFSRGKGRVSAFTTNIWTVAKRNGTSAWQQIESCKENF